MKTNEKLVSKIQYSNANHADVVSKFESKLREIKEDLKEKENKNLDLENQDFPDS